MKEFVCLKVQVFAGEKTPAKAAFLLPLKKKNGTPTKAEQQVIDTLSTIGYTFDVVGIIDTAQTGISARHSAEDALSYYQIEYAVTKNDILRANMNDTTITDVTDTVIQNINAFRNNGADAKLLASLYSDKGSFTQADSVITVIDNAGKHNLAKILAVYKELKQDGEPLEGIITDSVLQQKVRDVASDSTQDGYQYAISIMQQIFGTVYFEPIDDVNPPMEDRSLVSKPLPKADSPKKQTGYITCYPNPASESINFSYVLPTGTEQGIINIYSAYGQIIHSFTINNNEGIEVFDLTKQSQGLYFYSLLVNNINIDRGKFVINK